jgi:hypothetical protein
MKTIQTKTHILLVDETAEIKEGDFYIDITPINYGILYQSLGLSKSKGYEHWIKSTTGVIKEPITQCTKIIAAYPKINDVLEFETLPPNTEDDVEKLAESIVIKNNPNGVENMSMLVFNGLVNDITIALKQAKSETMFSLEDIHKVIDLARKEPRIMSGDIVESLTKLKEYEFIVEEEERFSVHGDKHDNTMKPDSVKQPKIVNNKIQGTWKLIS